MRALNGRGQQFLKRFNPQTCDGSRFKLPAPPVGDTLLFMGPPQPVKRYTPRDYYEFERTADLKRDYYDGEIFAMSGGTSRHSVIVINVGGELRLRLKGKPCAPHDSSQRLKIKTTGLRVYPDVSVYCDPIEYDEEDSYKDTATNPVAVFEVLSPSSEAYDRGFKLENFRLISSLRSYVLISQDQPHVEVYERRPDGSWLLREENRLDASIDIPGLPLSLPLAEIYDRIEFPSSAGLPRPRIDPT